MGASGIIYVYTKSGPLQTDTEVAKNFTKAKAMGYSSQRSFKAPDYSNPKTDASKTDFRSTIYWNPEVVTNSVTGVTEVSFYSSDLPGTYRIVGEGITQTGEPVRSIVFITVESD